jgi:hypothetical protein
VQLKDLGLRINAIPKAILKDSIFFTSVKNMETLGITASLQFYVGVGCRLTVKRSSPRHGPLAPCCPWGQLIQSTSPKKV